MADDTSPSDPPADGPQPSGGALGLLAHLKPRRGSPVPWAASAGLLCAGVAVSVGELISGITDKTPGLVLAVSDAIVDSSVVPGSLVRWSIDTFGSTQKPLLFYGVLGVTLALGVITGMAARRLRWVAAVVFGAFGVLGGLAANLNATASTTWAALSAGLAAAAGAGILWWLLGLINRAMAATEPAEGERPYAYLNETGRRWFLTAAGATAVAALVASGVGRYLTGRRGNVEADRADVADLLSQAEVRVDSSSAAASPGTTAAAGATPTTAGRTPGTTAAGDASPGTTAAGGQTTGTTAADGSEAPPPTTQAGGAEPAAAPAPADSGEATVATTEAQSTSATTAGGGETAGGAAPPVGEPGQRATTSTQAPTTATPAPPPPAPPARPSGYFDNAVAGISPIVTPNDDFYRIDTALVVPSVDVNSWKLSITGMVDKPYTLTFRELLDMGLVEVPVTLSCVSNRVGGNLVDNAVWRGVPLTQILDRAGVQSGATQVVGRSVDNWNSGFPTEVVHDGRVSLVAVAMNGEPLPRNHGFPVRLVVAGLYGYVSATKWLEEIRLTTWEGFDSYWVPRGWGKKGPIKTQSRIDVPRNSARVAAGRVAVAGVAWAPTRSIEGVEVQIDNGSWARADLGQNMSINSWRQWLYTWEATPGTHRIRVRATDGTGRTQTSDVRPPAPDGATGWHSIEVTAA